jgi:hypothetical protein
MSTRRVQILSMLLVGVLPACGENDAASESASTSEAETTTSTSAAASTDAPTTSSAGDESSSSGDTDAASSGAMEPPPGPWDHGEPIPPGDEAPGDPIAGYHALLNNGYVSCGVPSLVWPLAKPLLGQYTSGDPLPGRTGKNAEVPYNWTVHTPKSGVELVSLNCLECHAGKFNGELVLGLGVADMDFTSFPMSTLIDDLPLLPWPGGVLGEMNKFVSRYKAVGPYVSMLTVGTNPADMLAVRLASHRHVDTLEWSQEQLTPVPDLMAPVDTPPWWRAYKKNGLFYNGMARGDHRGTMMFASSLCIDSVEDAQQIMAYFDDIAAYVKSLREPTYPFTIDAELAAQGEPIFLSECAGCHGTYAADEADETYPNLIFPIEVIGTDDAVIAAADEIGYMVEWFNQSYYGSITQLVLDDPFPGYVAPPLDGVWATAPFFHNGSVPTIEAVLDSGSRPASWRRVDFDSAHFDEDALGWPFEALPYGQDAAPADQRKFIYDTTKPGHANTGHVFGDHLSPTERRAVLEYLKTI